jgi:hypothetical protein
MAPIAFEADAQAVACGENPRFVRCSVNTGTHEPMTANARKMSQESRTRKFGDAAGGSELFIKRTEPSVVGRVRAKSQRRSKAELQH